MMDKDELLTKITKLEVEHKNLTESYKPSVAAHEEAKEARDSVRKAYDLLREQLNAAETFLQEKKFSVDEITRKGRFVKDELESLKRDLGRMLDAEQVDEDYKRQVEEFREKALMSSWRGENRDDGYGAYKHQVEGAIHLAVTKQCLLGDKRGLGKSLTGLAGLDLIEAGKTIVIAPPDLVDNLIREFKLWAPHRHEHIWKLAEMNPVQRDFMLELIKKQPHWVVVLAYSSWRKDKRLIQDLIELKADSLLWDEAHHAKTWDTVTCKGLRDIRFGFNKCPGCGDDFNPALVQLDGDLKVMTERLYATCMRCGHHGPKTDFSTLEYVVPMTGTAIMNKPQELFPHMHLVDPINFPNEKAFLRDFCMQGEGGRWKWRYGGQKACLEQIGPRYLSRSKEDTDVIIPPYQNIDHIIPMTDMQENYPKQWAAYEQARKWAQIVLDPERQKVMTMVNKLSVITRLRQILVWPAGIELWDRYTDDDGVPHEDFIGRLEVEESIKVDKAISEIEAAFEEGERTVLFSMFKPALKVMRDRLVKKGIRAAIYDGSTTRGEKSRIERDFDPKFASDNPEYDVVLCNYRSAGEGLNFNSATNEILLDRHWHGAGEDQASGRINRIGSRRDSTVHRLMVDKSVDTWMEALITEKRDITDSFESQARLLQGMYDAILRGEL